MSRRLILSIVFIIPVLFTFAQGIYLSVNDFKNDKLSFCQVNGKKYKLSINEVFDKSTIKIKIEDSTFFLQKDSIFGYQNKENAVYRFYERDSYQILNPEEEILLYSQTFLGGYKNLQTVVNYYFSISLNDSIQALTKGNLKQSFPNDPIFHELLDAEFKTDSDLINFDSFYRIYKINRVYQFSREIMQKK